MSGVALSTTAVLGIYCALVLLASLTGGWLLLATRLNHARLQIAVSFVAGLGVAVLIGQFGAAGHDHGRQDSVSTRQAGTGWRMVVG